MNLLRVAMLLVATGATMIGMVNAQQSGPPLAELKASAEKGNAEAQAKLADAYRFNDSGLALEWYRKAGTQGVARAQCEAGRILIGFAGSWTAKPEVRVAHADEGIYWLVKAASQGDKRAQVDLGRQYEQAKFIKADQVEAYKWFALGARGGSPFDPVGLEAKWARDAIILKMSQAQIAEGEARVAAFAPGKVATRMPEPSWVKEIKLQGTSGTGEKRLAIINGRTFQKGDTLEVKAGNRSGKVQCLDVGESSALVSIEGLEGQRELKLDKD
jgi:hypothetical protein